MSKRSEDPQIEFTLPDEPRFFLNYGLLCPNCNLTVKVLKQTHRETKKQYWTLGCPYCRLQTEPCESLEIARRTFKLLKKIIAS
jgi:ssDNA-binding Zn-finger/Zn-ribbon topoisomerase 1